MAGSHNSKMKKSFEGKSKAGSRELLSAVTELNRDVWRISPGIGVYLQGCHCENHVDMSVGRDFVS